jgi:hypothetical protein
VFNNTNILIFYTTQTCLRACARLDEAGREGLWFPLFELFLDTQRAMQNVLKRTRDEYTAIVRELTRLVVNSMMGRCVFG